MVEAMMRKKVECFPIAFQQDVPFIVTSFLFVLYFFLTERKVPTDTGER